MGVYCEAEIRAEEHVFECFLENAVLMRQPVTLKAKSNLL